MVLVISTLVLVLGIILFGLSKSDNVRVPLSQTFEFVGVISIILSILIGFLLLGASLPMNTVKTEVSDYQIIDGKYHLMIDTKEEVEVLNEIKSLRMYKEGQPFKVYEIVKENSYGADLETEYIIESVKE